MPGLLTRLFLATLILLLPFASGCAERGEVPADAIVIDVRSETEWKAGHLENAILIPYDRVATDIAKVTGDHGAKLYLYCRSGRRSAIAAKTLSDAGYRNLVDLGSMKNAARIMKRRIISESSSP